MGDEFVTGMILLSVAALEEHGAAHFVTA